MSEKKVNLDMDFVLILECALRYALGRRTYITEFVANYIKKFIPYLETRDLAIIIKDIDRQRNDTLSDKPLGDEEDEEAWNDLYDEVKKEIDRRAK